MLLFFLFSRFAFYDIIEKLGMKISQSHKAKTADQADDFCNFMQKSSALFLLFSLIEFLSGGKVCYLVYH